MAQATSLPRVINAGSTTLLRSLLRGVVTLVLAVTLWPGVVAAQVIPGNCPSSLSMANIIDYDFTVSFCSEANGSILTWTLGNQFVNTAKWDFGTHEIASQ